MALLVWVVTPAIIPYVPLHPGITYWLSIIAGMAWQFVVALVILYRELGTLRWSAVRKRLWLQTPRDPKTDQPNPKLFWWVVPPLLIDVLVIVVLSGYLDAPMAWLFPGVKAPSYTDIAAIGYPRVPGPMVAPGNCPGQYYLQLFPGRGISLARHTPAQDARGFWKVRLGGKRRSLRFLSRA